MDKFFILNALLSFVFYKKIDLFLEKDKFHIIL